MITRIIEQRISKILENSAIRDIVQNEVALLMKERPEDIAVPEYCTTVAMFVLKEICRQTEKGCVGTPESDRISKRTVKPDMAAVLNGLLNWTQYELLGSNMQMVKALGNAVAVRDTGTVEHNLKVTIYASLMAEEVRLRRPQVQSLIKGSFLHDIGKIGIPDATLLKTGRLTDAEYRQMKSHVSRGEQIIRGVFWLEDARDVVLYHHERWDGTGYPMALKEREIPVNARIFAIVDVFDALVSERPYKKARTFEQAMEQMDKESGSHFDPDYYEIFTRISKNLYDDFTGRNIDELEDSLFDVVNKYFGLDKRSGYMGAIYESLKKSD